MILYTTRIVYSMLNLGSLCDGTLLVFFQGFVFLVSCKGFWSVWRVRCIKSSLSSFFCVIYKCANKIGSKDMWSGRVTVKIRLAHSDAQCGNSATENPKLVTLAHSCWRDLLCCWWDQETRPMRDCLLCPI